MGLLDTMLQNDVERNAPQIKPWNSNGFINSMNQYLNLSNNIDDTQRQNSILNLIAQREKDGIPYDRLADEVAKYDPSMAMNLQNQAQKSITWNRQESEAELANYKKAMAGWLGGVVLRRANEAVQKGTAQWDFDYVVKVCNECAAVIYPYDPTAAAALMNFGKQGITKKSIDTSRTKFTKDHELEGRFLTSINGNIKQSADPNADPNNYDRNTARYLAENRLMEWKAALPYTERNLGGRQLYSFMIDGLMREANRQKKGVGKFSDEEISAMYPDQAEQNIVASNNTEEMDEQDKSNDVPETPKAKSSQNQGPSNDEVNSVIEPPENLTKAGRGGRIVLDDSKTKKLQQYITQCVSLEELAKAKDTMSASASLEKDNSTVFKKLWDEINKKEKEINDVLGEADNATYEDLMKLKKLVGARNMNSVLVKSLRNFVNAMSGYTTTDTPYTSVTNWILVTQPDYKYINDDIEMAKTLRTNNNWTNVKSLMAKVGPFKSFRELMSREVAPDVMYAMAKDGTNAMRSWWKGISKGKTPEQIESIKLMYSNMFGIDDSFWPYIEGKARVPTPAEAEEMKAEYERNESSLPSINEINSFNYGKSSDSSSAITIKTLSNYDY